MKIQILIHPWVLEYVSPFLRICGLILLERTLSDRPIPFYEVQFSVQCLDGKENYWVKQFLKAHSFPNLHFRDLFNKLLIRGDIQKKSQSCWLPLEIISVLHTKKMVALVLFMPSARKISNKKKLWQNSKKITKLSLGNIFLVKQICARQF